MALNFQFLPQDSNVALWQEGQQIGVAFREKFFTTLYEGLASLASLEKKKDRELEKALVDLKKALRDKLQLLLIVDGIPQVINSGGLVYVEGNSDEKEKKEGIFFLKAIERKGAPYATGGVQPKDLGPAGGQFQIELVDAILASEACKVAGSALVREKIGKDGKAKKYVDSSNAGELKSNLEQLEMVFSDEIDEQIFKDFVTPFKDKDINELRKIALEGGGGREFGEEANAEAKLENLQPVPRQDEKEDGAIAQFSAWVKQEIKNKEIEDEKVANFFAQKLRLDFFKETNKHAYTQMFTASFSQGNDCKGGEVKPYSMGRVALAFNSREKNGTHYLGLEVVFYDKEGEKLRTDRGYNGLVAFIAAQKAGVECCLTNTSDDLSALYRQVSGEAAIQKSSSSSSSSLASLASLSIVNEPSNKKVKTKEENKEENKEANNQTSVVIVGGGCSV